MSVMIPGVNISDLIPVIGILGVAFIVFAESGLLFGFFLPGDTLLFTAGFLVQAGIFQVNIFVLVTVLFIAAVLGDSVGYTFGRRVGRKLYERKESKFFKKTHLEAAEKFYGKYGGKTVILARFLPTIRTFAPIVAGTTKMDYKKFIVYNMIGALGWAVGVTLLGYYLGQWFHSIGLEIDQVLLPCLAVIVLISWIPAFIHLMKNPDQRRAIWATTKREIKSLYVEDKK